MPQRWVCYYYPFETSPPPFYRMAIHLFAPEQYRKYVIFHFGCQWGDFHSYKTVTWKFGILRKVDMF
jgi:hypothetical protein